MNPPALPPPLRRGERWFQEFERRGNVRGFTEPFVHPLLRANLWLVRGADRDLVVDSGLGVARLRAALPEMFERDPLLVLTHAHADHAGGAHEFGDRLIHVAEAAMLASPEPVALQGESYQAGLRAAMAAAGHPLDGCLLERRPDTTFAIDGFTRRAAAAALVEAGQKLDIGGTAFTVLHLPGHSPGSLGLLDERAGTLFSGDAIYDGTLLDDLPGSDRDAYLATARRLMELPVAVVHAGHDPSFDARRLRELCAGYLASNA
ncbi:MAG: MBL fold metallo-hydrolase [Candidatus Dormibacteraceae bacterium]